MLGNYKYCQVVTYTNRIKMEKVVFELFVDQPLLQWCSDGTRHLSGPEPCWVRYEGTFTMCTTYNTFYPLLNSVKKLSF